MGDRGVCALLPSRQGTLSDRGQHGGTAYRNRHITGLDLAGDVITWAQTEPAGGSYVVRSSTTGAAMVTHLDGFFVGTTAINGGMTGWAGCEYSDCHASTIGVGNLPGPHSIASDGSRFLVDSYGSTLRLGPQKSLGEVGVPPRVARDGRRTAYTDTAGDLWVVTNDGVRTRVFDAATKVAIVRRPHRPERRSRSSALGRCRHRLG